MTHGMNSPCDWLFLTANLGVVLVVVFFLHTGPAIRLSLYGTDLLRQLFMLPKEDRSNLLSTQ